MCKDSRHISVICQVEVQASGFVSTFIRLAAQKPVLRSHVDRSRLRPPRAIFLIFGTMCSVPLRGAHRRGLTAPGECGIGGARGSSMTDDAERYVTHYLAESVAGMQYSFYWGTYTESTEGKINFEPLVFITPFSIGVSTGTGSTRPVYSVAVGYKYFGVSAAWNLGANQERPLVGLMASIPLDPLLNGLVWDIGGTAAKYFPGASF